LHLLRLVLLMALLCWQLRSRLLLLLLMRLRQGACMGALVCCSSR
jgi:hypothetical protein